MSPEDIPVVSLLPHGPEMTLLDALVSSTDASTVARVHVTPASKFAESDGVPAFVGIEYMAQTIAARVGYEAYQRCLPPPIGFLLGTRSYVCEQPTFPFGTTLTIRIIPLLVDRGFGSFECTIESDSIVASAVLNTYQPDPESLKTG